MLELGRRFGRNSHSKTRCRLTNKIKKVNIEIKKSCSGARTGRIFEKMAVT